MQELNDYDRIVSQIELYEARKRDRMNILVGCEESQQVLKALRKQGFNAYSCDLYPSSGGLPQYHFNDCIFKAINNKGGLTESGQIITVESWDVLIVFPPCTFLSTAGNRWFSVDPSRKEKRDQALQFVVNLWHCGIDRICLENPQGYLSSMWRKPSQTICPSQFGHTQRKRTCLWLKNLPMLKPTLIVHDASNAWLYQAFFENKGNIEEVRKLRSKTFRGIACAMASQFFSSPYQKELMFIDT